MKTFLFFMLISILTGYLCLSYGIRNSDVYVYKTAKYCGELSRERMKYTDSYKVEHLKVGIKTRDSNYLEKQIKEEEGASNKFYSYRFNKKPLYLYGLFVEVTYQAKNSLNEMMIGIGLCEFDTFVLQNGVFSYPKIKKIDIGGKTYYQNDISLHFNKKKAGLFDVRVVGFFDKVKYIFNKKQIELYVIKPIN